MLTQWAGYYYDGKTAARRKVLVTVTPHSLFLKKDDGSTIEWRLAQVTQTQGDFKNEPVRLEHGDEALVVEHHAFAKTLLGLYSDHAEKFSIPGDKRVPRWIPILAGSTIVFVVVAYIWLIPALAGIAADAVSPEWEHAFGATVARKLTEDSRECTEPGALAAINEIFNRLSESASANPYKFKLYVVKNPTVNAFAAPGGHIVFFGGLIKKTKSAEELAGVMAHEMQHVLKRHSTRSIFEQLSTSMLVALLTGNTSNAAELVHMAGVMRYMRGHEMEADLAAIPMLEKSGINPAGMTDFFKTLGKEDSKLNSTLSYISTHPASADRADYIGRAMKPNVQYQPLLAETDWKTSVADRICAPRDDIKPASSQGENLSAPTQ